VQDVFAVWAQQFGRRGWRWRASIGNEVRDGDVDLMADADNGRNLAGRDGACDALVVEGHEILE